MSDNLEGASESRRTGKEAVGNRRHCRHTGRLVTEEIGILNVILYFSIGKKVKTNPPPPYHIKSSL
jgi:hypothetical protein